MYRNIINTLAGKEEYLIKEHQNIEVTVMTLPFPKQKTTAITIICLGIMRHSSFTEEK